MLTIAFYGESQPLILPQDTDQTTEDVLVAAARLLTISPLCRHLFGLRNRSSGLWVSLGRGVDKLPVNPVLEFRLRFKPYTLERLKAIDRSAFDYLFHQVGVLFIYLFIIIIYLFIYFFVLLLCVCFFCVCILLLLFLCSVVFFVVFCSYYLIPWTLPIELP